MDAEPPHARPRGQAASNLTDRYARFVLRRRWPLLIALAMITVAAVGLLPGIEGQGGNLSGILSTSGPTIQGPPATAIGPDHHGTRVGRVRGQTVEQTRFPDTTGTMQEQHRERRVDGVQGGAEQLDLRAPVRRTGVAARSATRSPSVRAAVPLTGGGSSPDP